MFGIDLGDAAPAARSTAARDTQPAQDAGSRTPDAMDLFQVGELIRSTDLAAIGIPAPLYCKWAAAGILERTGQRGIYRATPALNEKVLEALVALG